MEKIRATDTSTIKNGKELFQNSHSKRRSRLGIEAYNFERDDTGYYRTSSSSSFFVKLFDVLLGSGILNRNQSFEMLRRAKLYLSSRIVSNLDFLSEFDWRRDWNQERYDIETLLDLFPSLKYSQEAMLPLSARLRRRGLNFGDVDWGGSPWSRMYLRDVAFTERRLSGSLFESFYRPRLVECPDVAGARDLFVCDYVDVVASKKHGHVSVRFDDICRSHSIWLDPVDAPKELYRWRLRIQRAIAWAYLNDCVPVMMTLTLFHRWHPLRELLEVLRQSWDAFLVSGHSALRRRREMELVGYVRRLEITINDGLSIEELNCGNCLKTYTPPDAATISPKNLTDFGAVFEAHSEKSCRKILEKTSLDAKNCRYDANLDGQPCRNRANNVNGDGGGDGTGIVTNAGWHPHMHVILFVPREKFDSLSDMEAQLKKDWVKIVCKRFSSVFGEEIHSSYLPAFERHGLYFSRYKAGEERGKIRPVHDCMYLDKIQGYDSLHVYGIDSEVSSAAVKNSKIPFDLLRVVSATNIDLWCEYALATKGVPALHFSRPFAKKVKEYFAEHPDEDPICSDLPPSEIVAHMDVEILRMFYRNFLIPELRKKAAEGYDALLSWVREKFVEFGLSELLDDVSALPRAPNTVEDLLVRKIRRDRDVEKQG